MPTYEYACRTCDTHLEVVQRFDDDPLDDCPGCGGRLRKVFSSIGISFKGSGFYKTDSRVLQKTSSASSSKATGGDGDGSSKGGDGGTATTTDGAPSKGKDSVKESGTTATKESKGTRGSPSTTTTAPAAKSA